MAQKVTPWPGCSALLAQLIAAGGPCDPSVKVFLFQNDVIPVRNPEVALTNADFSGYAETTVLLADISVGVDPIYGPGLLCPPQQWIADDPLTVENTIYGMWVAFNAGAGPQFYAMRFDEPIPVHFPGQFIEVPVFVPIGAVTTP
jgi:hypothetical protein